MVYIYLFIKLIINNTCFLLEKKNKVGCLSCDILTHKNKKLLKLFFFFFKAHLVAPKLFKFSPDTQKKTKTKTKTLRF